MKLKGILDFSLGNSLCLRGIKQLRFTEQETKFVPALKENLERFFKLKA